MDTQMNTEGQNTQNIEQNPVNQPVQIIQKPIINYWRISTIVLLFLIITFLLFGIKTNILTEKSRSDNNTVTKTPNISPTNSPEPQITALTTSETPTNDKSYGIFYPFSEGITINNSQPTIIGKISQTNTPYLATNFGIEKSPISNQDEYTLRFLPGKVINLDINIDGVSLQNVYGIPQYPTILCEQSNLNSDGTYTIDSKTGKKIPPDDIFTTENECYTKKSTDIPPLIFFAKLITKLPDGKHILNISNNGKNIGSMIFNLDNNYKIPSQTIAQVNQTNMFSGFDTVDNCAEGYYYDKNFLKIPLPNANNRNLFYGVSFPQTKTEYGSIQRRKIQIGFEGSLFDLFFPQSLVFYEGKSFTNNTLAPSDALFLPKDHLYFTDNTKANPQQIDKNSKYDSGKYFEIYPVDISGHEYRGFSFPWSTSSSSGCDG
jgi:hypothetical protein